MTLDEIKDWLPRFTNTFAFRFVFHRSFFSSSSFLLLEKIIGRVRCKIFVSLFFFFLSRPHIEETFYHE